jgi:hypothetical protein
MPTTLPDVVIAILGGWVAIAAGVGWYLNRETRKPITDEDRMYDRRERLLDLDELSDGTRDGRRPEDRGVTLEYIRERAMSGSGSRSASARPRLVDMSAGFTHSRSGQRQPDPNPRRRRRSGRP